MWKAEILFGAEFLKFITAITTAATPKSVLCHQDSFMCIYNCIISSISCHQGVVLLLAIIGR